MSLDEEKARVSLELSNLTSCLPKTGVSLICAYGSGVLPQVGHRDPRRNMVDLIVVVDDPLRWHAENLERNRGHYSFMRWFGAAAVADYQNSYPARVYYNTLVPIGDRYVKYGVIDSKRLIADLLDWEYLYISGRLHKPVYFMPIIDQQQQQIDKSASTASSTTIRSALRSNLESACHTALLLSPELLTWEEFYLRVCSLSYNGDFRQVIGEDKHKVRNIVEANAERFHRLYWPILRAMSKLVHIGPSSNKISQDLSAPAVHHHLEMLPKHVQWNLQSYWNNRDGRARDIEEVIFQLANTFDFPPYVDRALRSIVFRSSVKQTLKNVLSAGIRKSILYSFAKLGKMFRSIRR